MNYRLVFITIILSILIAPISVSAKEYLIIDCNKSGKEYICDIKGNYDEEVTALEYTYSLPKNVTLIDFIKDSSWEGTNENNMISLYTDVNKSGVFNIGKLKLKTSKNFKSNDIKTEKLLFYDSSFQEIELENNSVKNEKNKVNNSKSIIYLIIGCVIIFIVVVVFLSIKKKGVLR